MIYGYSIIIQYTQGVIIKAALASLCSPYLGCVCYLQLFSCLINAGFLDRIGSSKISACIMSGLAELKTSSAAGWAWGSAFGG